MIESYHAAIMGDYAMKHALLLLSLILPAAGADSPPLAIRNARVVPVSGPILKKATVVVRNGLIAAVGENIDVPKDAWVVEGEGLTVYPGLIDALSNWGIPEAAAPVGASAAGRSAAPVRQGPPSTPSTPDAAATPQARGPEDRPSNTSWQRAADLVKPTDRRLETARSAGFTSAVTFPMTGIFAGQGAVINLAGEKAPQMVVASGVGQYLTLSSGSGFGGGFPGSLMGVLAYIRQMYIDADYYRLAKADYEKRPAGARRPDYDRASEGVLESPRILLPAVRALEIDRALRLAAEVKRPAVIYGAHEGYNAAEMLKKAGAPVLVSLKWPERLRDADPDLPETMRTLELRDKAPSTPAALVKAGVKFAFYTDKIDRPRDAVRAVRRAIEAGLSQDDAVRALTLTAAEIYGVASQMGSIEPGKIANLLVVSGDLFQDKTQVKFVLIDGVKYEPAPETPTPAEGVAQ
jgi:imidazolonepropionase-like amidohydrolase